MSISVQEPTPGSLELHIDGVVHEEDYDRMIPAIEDSIEANDAINLLIELKDFEGWMPADRWEKLDFVGDRKGAIGRVALVGEKSSHKWMASISRPFAGAEVRFFADSDIDQARQWMEEA